ncbi:hypothetical protein EJB05_34865, partial [Eragrostis curvula]
MVQLGPALVPSVVVSSCHTCHFLVDLHLLIFPFDMSFAHRIILLVLVRLAVDFNLTGTVEAPGGEDGKPLELLARSQVTAPGPAGVGSRSGRDEDAGLYGVGVVTANDQISCVYRFSAAVEGLLVLLAVGLGFGLLLFNNPWQSLAGMKGVVVFCRTPQPLFYGHRRSLTLGIDVSPDPWCAAAQQISSDTNKTARKGAAFH